MAGEWSSGKEQSEVDASELPEIGDWVEMVGSYNPKSFCAAKVPVAHAYAVAEICWPEFIEYRGMILLKHSFDESGVNAWLVRLDGNRSAVEGVVNEVHLWDLFPLGLEAEYQALNEMAPKIAKMWSAAAQAAFPKKRFSVSLDVSPNAYGPTLTMVTVE